MAYHKESLKLEMKEVIYVKPSSPIPSSILSLSDFDLRNDCNGMGQIILVYQSSNLDSPNNKLDPFLVIKEALSKAMFYYYPLAGRLVENGDRKLSIHLEPNHGVPLVEAIANCHLSYLEYLDGNDVEIANKLAFDLPLQDKNGHQYPLVLKVTKFLCGSFTIGLGVSHVVCDGVGVAQFFKAMNELASGKSEPSIKPVWKRECVLVGSINKQPFQDPMGMDTLAISPYLPTSNLVHGCIKFCL
ncbi:putative 10-deacetylbaccatin III 10-O-acetyltransferase [Lupinus albus]|uniref:Putative 10-deacetylbaccatin III 10-O-acetyltransferase n=1 Tax=Lupinus albus TaxID=3870 RepID=A0A6A4QWG7_LUPAL|nr:putative 10-deacetylbaccatin III 10-O-acetyltransferase [Lupinus albus]